MKFSRLAVVASIVSAGCATQPPDNTYAFRPGNGTVESVHQARVAIPGGTAPKTWLGEATSPRWVQGYQLALRMDDGTTQAITQDSDAFHAGDRVQVASNGRVIKLPTTAAAPASTATALRAGSGTIQSVGPSAAAGGTAAEQLGINMDDGTTQVINVQGATFQPGERVTVTTDGRVLR
jgi:outer membrane lipoprotein SlyB